MAFKGFMVKNSYSNIVLFYYNKQERNITFNVNTYTDDSCKILLNAAKYEMIGNSEESITNWDSLFGIAKQKEKGIDLIACIYEYLKAKPEFASVKDC